MTTENSIITSANNPLLIGHEEAEKTMLHAYNSGKMPHAWLISGVRGIGKATLAYRFAKFLFASDEMGGLFGAPDSLQMDENHPVFRRITQGSYSDLLVIETKEDPKTGVVAKEIVVDDARKIGKFLRLTPAESKYRIVIIDSVDEMNRNAANSILKLLEEPPVNAIMLLVSHAPGKLLPTIRSRCRHLKMRPLADENVRKVLQHVTPELDEPTALRLAHFADGSPGFAFELEQYQGLALYSEIIAILKTLPRLDVSSVYKLGEKLAAKNNQVSWRLTSYLIPFFLHKVIKYHSTGNLPAYEEVEGENQLIMQLSATKPLETWLEIWEQSRQLFADTDRVNLDRTMTTLSLFEMMRKAA